VLGWAGPGWAVLGWAGPGWAVLGWAGVIASYRSARWSWNKMVAPRTIENSQPLARFIPSWIMALATLARFNVG